MDFSKKKPDFIEPGVVGAEFTMGAEFSRIYGTFLHCFHICDTKCTYEDTAVQTVRWFLLALQFVGPKPCKSFFVLTKHINAVSLKLHWTACWKKMRLRPLTLNGNFILQIKTFTNSVFVVFPYFIGGSIQALCVLRAVQCVLCALCANKQECGFLILSRNGGLDFESLTINYFKYLY